MKAAHSSRRLSRSAPGSSSTRTCRLRTPGSAGGSSASTVSTATTPAAASHAGDEQDAAPPTYSPADTGTMPPAPGSAMQASLSEPSFSTGNQPHRKSAGKQNQLTCKICYTITST
uniref:Uncharacterized protein n=1 Tax=Cairina moschata TaxID=8855 RepID=A0A8C3BNL9_CAIMO